MNKNTFNKSDFEILECPLCGTLRAPSRVVLTKDKTEVKYVSYKCQPDHVKHGRVYTWKITANGELVD